MYMIFAGELTRCHNLVPAAPGHIIKIPTFRQGKKVQFLLVCALQGLAEEVDMDTCTGRSREFI